MSSEALAPVLRPAGSGTTEDGKEDRSFGELRRTKGATGSCPWGFTWLQEIGVVCKDLRFIAGEDEAIFDSVKIHFAASRERAKFVFIGNFKKFRP